MTSIILCIIYCVSIAKYYTSYIIHYFSWKNVKATCKWFLADLSSHHERTGWKVTMLVHGQSVDSWSNCWFMVKLLVHDQTVSSWSNCWSMINVFVPGQTVGPWSKCWFMVKLLVHDQSVGSWSNCWSVVKLLIARYFQCQIISYALE